LEFGDGLVEHPLPLKGLSAPVARPKKVGIQLQTFAALFNRLVILSSEAKCPDGK
jgi:hypothetical protein